MLRAEHKSLVLGKLNVHYVQAGQGPVVLLLHGLGTSLVTWSRNIEPLAAAGFTVLAPDLPGHGDSDKPAHLSYDPVDGARLIHQFLQSLGVERVSLVGNSAGGLVVGLFALSHPEKVDRLVLVASGGLGRRVSWFLRVFSLPVLGELLYQPQLQNVDISKRIFYQAPPFLDEIMAEMYRVRALPGVRRAGLRAIRSSINFLGLRQNRYILPRLKQSPVPLLTVWGREDNIIPVSHARLVRQELPHSVVRIMPQCGHWPHMEKAEQFNDLLIRFLRGALDDGTHPTDI
jgi:4,5:9,10-diseco-3-hydroxy-5,9,17-trioxoandrosta-1(10),2-diene-4-oate hydrolase